MNLSYSFLFIVVLYLFEFREFFLLLGMLDLGFLRGIGEVRTGVSHVSLFVAVEA